MSSYFGQTVAYIYQKYYSAWVEESLVSAARNRSMKRPLAMEHDQSLLMAVVIGHFLIQI